MPKVAAVKLRYNPKVLWFDPAGVNIAVGDHLLVDTERGQEVALAMNPALDVTEAQISGLAAPLKKVIRVLDEQDFETVDRLDAKGHAAMPRFRELIDKYELDIKAVAVVYTFSGDRATYFFSSDVRIDFRELVRELASEMHIRIDMRQIGVRDEARMLGGLAHCGEELCCTRLGGGFEPVSIRMAKEQDLPLNPVKISGACGRLMCCLRYEFETYKDFKSRAPKKGALIETPLGTAKVVDFNTPSEVISLRLEDGKQMDIPLADFDCKKNDNGSCARPCCVGREAVDKCTSTNIQLALAALDRKDTLDELTDKPATPRRRERTRKKKTAAASGSAKTDTATASSPAGGSSKPRPGQRSSGLRNPQGAQGGANAQSADIAQGKKRSSRNRRRRPSGQNNGGSGAANNTGNNAGKNSASNNSANNNASNNASTQAAQGGQSTARKPRRRRTTGGNSQAK